ncbi:ATP-binding cassette domain-containing protein [Bartonella apis]|uniref:ATP-binding cassette domain-containing protein n=1 Tax=Bartonella apis TaxID=1686310 RepID=UPI00399766F5
MDKEWLLSLTKAGIERNGRWLVHDIDLDIYRGEIVTLIGPNGSGKSTTAKMALGILKPSAGTVTRKAGLRIGYVPQRLVIDPSLPLTVRRFMTLTAKLDAQKLASVLSETGVADLENANVADLSGGELQRVLLARSIARKPDLLVLDEPLQGVDYNGETELYGLIASLRTKLECGILLVSHDLHIVMAATDRVICLNGHICCSGAPTEVAQSEAYGRLVGAIPENGLALYEHHHNHRHNIHGAVINTPAGKTTKNIGANDNA